MNIRQLTVASISRTVADMVRAPGFWARVLHAFPQAVNLLTDDGAVVTLADLGVGDGPLNMVVSASAPFGRVTAELRVCGDGERLYIGDLTVDLADATLWEPRWPWPSVPSPQSAVPGPQPPVGGQQSAIISHPAIADLRAALRDDDRRKLAEAAAALAGRGPGLTPAGDDFLAGVMWGLRFRPNGRDVDALCAVIVDAATPRTTPLSAALLHAAGAGLADARWHALFDALDRGGDATAALRAVLAQGATSGADAWAGFQFVAPLDQGLKGEKHGQDNVRGNCSIRRIRAHSQRTAGEIAATTW